MPNEIELKLRIAATDVPRLRRHRALRQHLVSRPVTRKLTSIYYDTPGLQLLDAAISLRVRRMSGNWFQAVKAAGHSLAGLHQRMEWEDIIARGQPDFSKITEPVLARIFADQVLRDALEPIFITEVNRTEWQLQYADGSAIEMALDLGELQVGRKKDAIREIELELKHGKPGHLFELALVLQADIPLHIENVSKAQRGYAYYRPDPPGSSKAKAVVLSPRTSIPEAFQQIAWECLRQLQANQDMVLRGDDTEGVHQMRIGLRRLRIVLKLFKHRHAVLETELDWLNDLLGNARDWDVLLHETLPAANSLPSATHHALAELAGKAQKLAYSRLRTALNSKRYQRLLLTLGAWLHSDYKQTRKKLLPFADSRLQKAYDKLDISGNPGSHNISSLGPEQRHKVRIAVKNLRYAADFFTSLYKGKKQAHKTRSFIENLSQLQTLLGTMNDITSAQKLLPQLTGKVRIHDSAEIDALVRWNEARLLETCIALDKSWHNLMQTEPYWN